MIGLIDPTEGSYFLPYITLDPTRFVEGSPREFNQYTTGGWLFYSDNTYGGEFVEAGYLGDGTLQFDVLDTSAGGQVNGTLSTNLYVWQQL